MSTPIDVNALAIRGIINVDAGEGAWPVLRTGTISSRPTLFPTLYGEETETVERSLIGNHAHTSLGLFVLRSMILSDMLPALADVFGDLYIYVGVGEGQILETTDMTANPDDGIARMAPFGPADAELASFLLSVTGHDPDVHDRTAGMLADMLTIYNLSRAIGPDGFRPYGVDMRVHADGNGGWIYGGDPADTAAHGLMRYLPGPDARSIDARVDMIPWDSMMTTMGDRRG